MVLTRLSSDVRSLLLILAVALSLLIIAPNAAQAGVNGCPHYNTTHFHNLIRHWYTFIEHENIRVDGQGWVHSHLYRDKDYLGFSRNIYKIC
jgi:hypothetical protein